MIFPCSPLPDFKDKIILAPLIPVTFRNKNFEFSTFALVDSGASGAVISTVIAEALNIKWEKIPVTQGFSVGGSFRFYRFTDLKAIIYDTKLMADHEFALSVSIIEAISLYKCILGQKDLFQRAKITFEGYKSQLEVNFREYN
ncbi:MAG: hypothetical protein A3B44_02880 [Candidatus Levybacteria bacterium RIFCSPLOWO2_01_FULL_38_21]|nr:MAG: hypothetical protein A3B44_02880 [Candidatus Levybacteria bacterium RIFCSPLOWO2_01_FULL_38_21]